MSNPFFTGPGGTSPSSQPSAASGTVIGEEVTNTSPSDEQKAEGIESKKFRHAQIDGQKYKLHFGEDGKMVAIEVVDANHPEKSGAYAKFDPPKDIDLKKPEALRRVVSGGVIIGEEIENTNPSPQEQAAGVKSDHYVEAVVNGQRCNLCLSGSKLVGIEIKDPDHPERVGNYTKLESPQDFNRYDHKAIANAVNEAPLSLGESDNPARSHSQAQQDAGIDSSKFHHFRLGKNECNMHLNRDGKLVGVEVLDPAHPEKAGTFTKVEPPQDFDAKKGAQVKGQIENVLGKHTETAGPSREEGLAIPPASGILLPPTPTPPKQAKARDQAPPVSGNPTDKTKPLFTDEQIDFLKKREAYVQTDIDRIKGLGDKATKKDKVRLGFDEAVLKLSQTWRDEKKVGTQEHIDSLKEYGENAAKLIDSGAVKINGKQFEAMKGMAQQELDQTRKQMQEAGIPSDKIEATVAQIKDNQDKILGAFEKQLGKGQTVAVDQSQGREGSDKAPAITPRGEAKTGGVAGEGAHAATASSKVLEVADKIPGVREVARLTSQVVGAGQVISSAVAGVGKVPSTNAGRGAS